MDRIQRYQELCLGCYAYRRGLCGYIFADKRIPESERLPNDIGPMEYNGDWTIYLTQAYGEPCNTQDNSSGFLNAVESDLREVVPGVDEDTVNTVLQRAYRILHKYNVEETLFKNTTIGTDVQQAIDLVMAHIDLDSLQNGASIYRLIQSADVGYNRDRGLYKIYPRKMAVSLICRALVQDEDGYFESDGAYDARTLDVGRKSFIGPSWLDVMEYQKKTNPDESGTSIKRVKHSDEPSTPPDDILPELKKLIEAGILTNSLQLKHKQSRRSMVEYCIRHKLFRPWHLENWRSIDKMITDRSGHQITAESFKQAFQDYQKTHVIE